jgi:hypothetical protein
MEHLLPDTMLSPGYVNLMKAIPGRDETEWIKTQSSARARLSSRCSPSRTDRQTERQAEKQNGERERKREISFKRSLAPNKEKQRSVKEETE